VHAIQFGNLKLILLEPGNIKRMMMGKAVNCPINQTNDPRISDTTRNVLIAYIPDIPRFVERFKAINIGNITELGKLIMEAREWPEKMR
jgi:hypothetical protein